MPGLRGVDRVADDRRLAGAGAQVRLERVEDAGHPVVRLVDLDGRLMGCGLFVDRGSAAEECRRRRWRLIEEEAATAARRTA